MPLGSFPDFDTSSGTDVLSSSQTEFPSGYVRSLGKSIHAVADFLRNAKKEETFDSLILP